jgi:hypothetical protein
MVHFAFLRINAVTIELKTFKCSLLYDNETCSKGCRPVMMTENSSNENGSKILVTSKCVEQVNISEINIHFKDFVLSVKPFSNFQTDTRSCDVAARIDFSSGKRFYVQ